jgi:hypothetical protein
MQCSLKDARFPLCNPNFGCTPVSLKDTDPFLPFLFSEGSHNLGGTGEGRVQGRGQWRGCI